MAKNKRKRKAYEIEEPIPRTFRSNNPHVAQDYLAAGDPKSAYSLTRDLRRPARVAVLGNVQEETIT